MVEELKEKVFKANLDLVKHGLVIFTWGNVSAIDRKKGPVRNKPFRSFLRNDENQRHGGARLGRECYGR